MWDQNQMYFWNAGIDSYVHSAARVQAGIGLGYLVKQLVPTAAHGF